MLGRVTYLIIVLPCCLVSAHLVLSARLLEAEFTEVLLIEHEAFLRRVNIAGDFILASAHFFA